MVQNCTNNLALLCSEYEEIQFLDIKDLIDKISQV